MLLEVSMVRKKGLARGGGALLVRRWGHVISDKLSSVVGNKQRVKFWKDKWCGDTPFSHSFTSLFSTTLSKEA